MLLSARMSTREVLQELLSQRILLLDGSMGALIYSRQPTEEDYRGERFRTHPVSLKNCTEALVLTQPRMIEDIHRAYLNAGADFTNRDGDRPRFVAGSIGPTNRTLYIEPSRPDQGSRTYSFEDFVASY